MTSPKILCSGASIRSEQGWSLRSCAHQHITTTVLKSLICVLPWWCVVLPFGWGMFSPIHIRLCNKFPPRLFCSIHGV